MWSGIPVPWCRVEYLGMLFSSSAFVLVAARAAVGKARLVAGAALSILAIINVDSRIYDILVRATLLFSRPPFERLGIWTIWRQLILVFSGVCYGYQETHLARPDAFNWALCIFRPKSWASCWDGQWNFSELRKHLLPGYAFWES